MTARGSRSKSTGRPRKYASTDEARRAKNAANRRWRLKHPAQWKRMQAASYRRRKAKMQKDGKNP